MTEWLKQASVPPMWKPEKGQMVIGEIVGIKETDNGILYTVKLLEDASLNVKYIDDAEDAPSQLIDFQAGTKITLPGHAGIVGALEGFDVGTLVKITNNGSMPAKKGKNAMYLYSVMTGIGPTHITGNVRQAKF